MRFIYKPNNDTGQWSTEIYEDGVLPEGFTDIAPPSTPTYKPYFNWITNEWEEHATQEEIISITNQPNTEPTEMEYMMLAIAEIDAQRAVDKTESEMAIAELAEALMGGV